MLIFAILRSSVLVSKTEYDAAESLPLNPVLQPVGLVYSGLKLHLTIFPKTICQGKHVVSIIGERHEDCKRIAQRLRRRIGLLANLCRLAKIEQGCTGLAKQQSRRSTPEDASTQAADEANKYRSVHSRKTQNMNRLNFGFRTVWFGLVLSFSCVSSTLAQKDAFDRDALMVKDSVVLRSGSQLFGTVQSEGVDDEGRKYIIFQTDDGGLLKLDLARMVFRNRVRKIDEIDREYNQHISRLEDTPDAHWELYEWCGNQPSGSVRFKDQRQFHLERIMELDPNDDIAKRKLGYQYLREQDRWVPEERYHQSLGYERRGTSWAPMKQRDVDRRHDLVESAEGDRKAAFRVWSKEASKPNPNVAALRADLFRICDATAVPIIFNAAREEKSPAIRALFIEAIGRVPTQVALNALCVFAIEDQVADNRDRALALLSQDHFNKPTAVAVLATYLASESNVYVRRAAFGIGELGDAGSTLALVNALVTTHLVKPAGQAGRIQTGVGTDGNVNGLSLGGDTKPVMRDIPNPEVVNALKKISKQDFGFDALAWQNWFISNHTHYDVKVRR